MGNKCYYNSISLTIYTHFFLLKLKTFSYITQQNKSKREKNFQNIARGKYTHTHTHTHTYIGEGNGIPLQYSCLENPMDGGAWWAAVSGVAKSRTRLSDFTFPFHFLALEKEMTTHSSVLAWRIPGTGEPDGLPSMGSHRVGHDRSDLAAAAAAYIYIIYILHLPEK